MIISQFAAILQLLPKRLHCDCLMCILAPGKWSVVLAKNRRRCDIVDALSLKLISDQDSCVEFVSLIDLLLSQVADTWNVFVNIVCMGRTVARDISSCLRPRCRPGRVGMHDTANIRETVVKYHGVAVSEEGLYLPSTLLPCKSTTTISSGVSLS